MLLLISVLHKDKAPYVSKGTIQIPRKCAFSKLAGHNHMVNIGMICRYANRHCHFEAERWSCALCGHENELGSIAARR